MPYNNEGNTTHAVTKSAIEPLWQRAMTTTQWKNNINGHVAPDMQVHEQGGKSKRR